MIQMDGYVDCWMIPHLEVIDVLSSDFQFVARMGDSLLKVEGADGIFGALAELQLQYDNTMSARIQNYCAMARQKYQLRILPIVVYLTPPGEDENIATAYYDEFMGLVSIFSNFRGKRS